MVSIEAWRRRANQLPKSYAGVYCCTAHLAVGINNPCPNHPPIPLRELWAAHGLARIYDEDFSIPAYAQGTEVS